MTIRVFSVALVVTLILLMFFPGRFYRINDNLIGGVLVTVSLCIGALDLALGAGRIFASEAKWKTLSGLVMLPATTAKLAFQKVAALAVSALPYLALSSLGFILLGARDTQDFFEEAFRPAGIYVIATFLLCLHLTAIFSLIVKGGPLVALIVAVSIIIAGNFIIAFMLASGMGRSDDGVFLFLAICAGGLCAYLQVVIARRLETMAAAE